MNSSTSISAPAAPNACPSDIASIAASASAIVAATITPLPGGQSRGLDHDRRPEVSAARFAAAASVWRLGPRRRHAGVDHELLGEDFGAFDACRGGLVGPKIGRPALLEAVDDAERERCFGSDDGQIRPLARGERDKRSMSVAATATHRASSAMPGFPVRQ